MADLGRRALLKGAGLGLVAGWAPAAAAAEPAVDAAFEGFALPPSSGGDESLRRVQDKGRLAVATSNDWPYSFLDPQTGEWSGVDADIIRFVARMLKIAAIDVQTVAWDGLIPSLLSGRCDCIGDAIDYTVERSAVVRFSFPTYFYTEALVVPAGNPLGLHGLADLAGHRVGTLLGSNYAEWLAGRPGVELQNFPGLGEMLPQLAVGRVDAVLYDEPVMRAQLKAHPDWKLELAAGYRSSITRTPCRYTRYALRPADSQLAGGFDAALQWMEYRGEMEKILIRWNFSNQNC